MIKIIQSNDKNFYKTYNDVIVESYIYPRLKKISGIIEKEHKENFDLLFNKESTKDIVFANPEELEVIIKTIFNLLPIIGERFFLGYYLQSLSLPDDAGTYPAKTKVEKKLIDNLLTSLSNELKVISKNISSILIPLLLNELEKLTNYTDKKKFFTKAINIKNGASDFCEQNKGLFPKWLSNLKSAFNYTYMSRKFGKDLTSISVSVCPYCNFEPVIFIDDKKRKIKPDLDHFHPKSLFPFLAVTISNLVPSGDVCNSKFKQTHHMLNHVNPFSSGVNDSALFEVNYLDNGIFVPEIRIVSQGNNLDRNMQTLSIESLYNSESADYAKGWLKERWDIKHILLEFGEELENYFRTPIGKIGLNVDALPTKHPLQKLKIDFINQITGSSIKMNRN
jgi:hypothetical protein